MEKLRTFWKREWFKHVLFWLLYTLFWHLVFSPNRFDLAGLTTSVLYTLVHAAVSYLNLYLLIPQLLNRRRWYLTYIGVLTLAMVGGAALLGGLLYGWFYLLSPAAAAGFFDDPSYLIASLLGSTVTATGLTTVLQLVRQRRKMEKREQELEKEKMEAELRFLRGQLDPHFLFNALNSIYFLIKKDPDRAADALAGFSDLLRYQLYRANETVIPLSQELDYLRRYAQLARLRRPSSLKVELNLPARVNGAQVPPLLLLPLVENAFKYVRREAGCIRAGASIDGARFHFRITNDKEPAGGDYETKDEGGIGLNNLRRRLDLLYPDAHELNIDDTEGQYTVDLTLNLNA